MHPFPHVYTVDAAAANRGNVTLSASGVPDLPSAPPLQFDGPGDQWSPESLLCAAVADCFILSFRAFAHASKFDWLTLECRTEGKLERVQGVSRFTSFSTRARLRLPAGADHEKARTLLEKAERGCLVSNTLNAERLLESEITE